MYNRSILIRNENRLRSIGDRIAACNLLAKLDAFMNCYAYEGKFKKLYHVYILDVTITDLQYTKSECKE